MVGKITPLYIPKPVGVLVYDGTDFYALKGDVAGNLVLGSKVESGDQHRTYKDTLHVLTQATISGAGGYIDSGTVPAGEVWYISHITSRDNTTATTSHEYSLVVGGVLYRFIVMRGTYGVAYVVDSGCDLYLKVGDKIRISYIGGAANDVCVMWVHGYTMSLV